VLHSDCNYLQDGELFKSILTAKNGLQIARRLFPSTDNRICFVQSDHIKILEPPQGFDAAELSLRGVKLDR
jgi:hypothetical protein